MLLASVTRCQLCVKTATEGEDKCGFDSELPEGVACQSLSRSLPKSLNIHLLFQQISQGAEIQVQISGT